MRNEVVGVLSTAIIKEDIYLVCDCIYKHTICNWTVAQVFNNSLYYDMRVKPRRIENP